MHSLWGRRILVLEDEYFLAEELGRMLEVEGVIIVGRYPTLEAAMGTRVDQIDGAILNVRVHDGPSYPLARKLRESGVPFVFASGQDRLSEPTEWQDNEWVPKPYKARELIEALRRVMGWNMDKLPRNNPCP